MYRSNILYNKIACNKNIFEVDKLNYKNKLLMLLNIL